ncbi:MAG TPA: glutamine synthetase family protein [Candidatus Limnocylindrales bacterium]|nr:glutamine synthetase family protein [Candidatus Limnocylindrales bacterium]
MVDSNGDAAATTARLAALEASVLWVVYHDYAGLGRAKAVPAARFAEVAAEGVTFAMANWDLGVTDEQVPHPGFGADSGDFRAVPDAATIVAVPGRPSVAQSFARLTDDRGGPWPGDPRAILATQVERLLGAGVAVRAAFEAEFVVVPRADSGALLRDTGRMFAVEGLDARWELGGRILADLAAAGIEVHQLAKEYGPGQFEVSLLPADPLVAADRYLLARQLIRAAARDAGLTASFMPKPFASLPGNGLHVHLGLTRADDPGSDLVADPADPEAIAPSAGPAIAGLLAHARGQAAIAAPTANSYKRLLPGSWAPAHVCWAVGNRSALVRIPGRGDGRHLEYRSGDAAMNPYLHLAGLLAAIRDGVEHELRPPRAADVDVGHLTDDEAAERGADRLPSRLDVALDALAADDVLLAALGPVVAVHYDAVKRFEWDLYLERSGLPPDAIDVSDWERRTWFEHL